MRLSALQDRCRDSLGFDRTVTLDDDVIVNGTPPMDDDEGSAETGLTGDARDPCEKPLALNCEFAREPDITYLLMPPFIGPWEDPQLMQLHWTIFVLVPSRWMLVCPAYGS